MEIVKKSRSVLTSNPLKEVIVQFQFPRNMEIEEGLPVLFQKEISSEFPLFEAQETFNFDFKVEDNNPIISKSQRAPVYHFKNEAGDHRVSLSSDFIALSSNQYTNWESFRQLILLAFSKLRTIYSLSVVSRIGLRYRNIICRSEFGLSNEPWDQLIKPGALGIAITPGMFQGDTNEQAMEALHTLTQLNLSRYSLLVQTGLTDMNDGSKEKCFFIDNDFFSANLVKVKEFDFEAKLEELHDDAESVFRHLITDKLYERFTAS